MKCIARRRSKEKAKMRISEGGVVIVVIAIGVAIWVKLITHIFF